MFDLRYEREPYPDGISHGFLRFPGLSALDFRFGSPSSPGLGIVVPRFRPGPSLDVTL